MADGGSWVAIAQVVLDWIKAPWKVFTVLFLISIAALLLPQKFTDSIHMTSTITQFWPWIVFASSFFGLFLLITGVEECIKPLRARRKHKRETDEKYSKIERILKSLRNDEAVVLGYFGPGHSSQNLDISEGVPQHLVNKGILYCSRKLDYVGTYSLTPAIEQYLADRKFQTVIEAIQALKAQK